MFIETSIGRVDVKLDRITITGWIKADNDAIEEMMAELGWELQPELKAKAPWFKLERNVGGEVYETVAVFMKNQFHNSWRLDTSNHLRGSKELKAIQRVILLMGHRHITRIDIAFDFINCKYPGMKHTIVKPNVTTKNYMQTKFYGRSGAIETLYVGKRKSLSMYRYYDKLVEQARARKKIPADVDTWERLEIQLRGSKTSEWVAEAENMLYRFKLPMVSQLSVNDQTNLLMLTEHPEVFQLFAKEKKAKYRKMYRENKGMNTEYAKTACEVLKKKMPLIENEIQEFLLTVE